MPKIVDVIKYEGDNSTFVWKHPCEDFNTNTQLIVHECQVVSKKSYRWIFDNGCSWQITHN